MKRRNNNHLLTLVALGFTLGLFPVVATAQMPVPLKNICHVKGQEEESLRGFGIVTGLRGTGDGGDFLPAIRALARIMEHMGHPPLTGLEELKNTKNVAVVDVQVTIPASGARQGEKLDCVVNSYGTAKSLEGGHLFLTYLVGPNPTGEQVYATAEGRIRLVDPEIPTYGKITRGVQLQEDFINPFVENNTITLVIDDDHADFALADYIVNQINSGIAEQSDGSLGHWASAKDKKNILIEIPAYMKSNPVKFVRQVFTHTVLQVAEPGARVTINETTGVVTVSGDVIIGPAVVTHNNIIVNTGAANAVGGRFVPVDQAGTSQATLKGLLEALNAINVPPADVIGIIKSLKRNGRIHARVDYE